MNSSTSKKTRGYHITYLTPADHFTKLRSVASPCRTKDEVAEFARGLRAGGARPHRAYSPNGRTKIEL